MPPLLRRSARGSSPLAAPELRGLASSLGARSAGLLAAAGAGVSGLTAAAALSSRLGGGGSAPLQTDRRQSFAWDGLGMVDKGSIDTLRSYHDCVPNYPFSTEAVEKSLAGFRAEPNTLGSLKHPSTVAGDLMLDNLV